MFCRKCGKQLREDDNFCPKCGVPVERKTEEEVIDNGVVEFDPDKVPEESESLDLKWDVEDFHREEKKEDVEIEWGDLLGTKKPEADAKKTLMDMVDEAAEPVGDESRAFETSMFETEQAGALKDKISEDSETAAKEFDTFNEKNREFRDLLEKERERVKSAKEERAKRLEDLGLADENSSMEEDEDHEGRPSAAERIKKRREERAKRDMTQITEPVLPLKLDQNEICGSWPPTPETGEVTEEPVHEEHEPVETDPAVEAMKKGHTQQISREDFAAFLKQAEEQFGFEDIDENTEEEPVGEPEPEPEVFEPVAEEKAEITEIEEPVSDASSEETAEVTDESFWDEEDEYKEKGGGKFLTFLIVLLAIILALQIAVLVIRFQFPDSQIAGIIEPVMTKIEDWIRGLF